MNPLGREAQARDTESLPGLIQTCTALASPSARDGGARWFDPFGVTVTGDGAYDSDSRDVRSGWGGTSANARSLRAPYGGPGAIERRAAPPEAPAPDRDAASAGDGSLLPCSLAPCPLSVLPSRSLCWRLLSPPPVLFLSSRPLARLPGLHRLVTSASRSRCPPREAPSKTRPEAWPRPQQGSGGHFSGGITRDRYDVPAGAHGASRPRPRHRLRLWHASGGGGNPGFCPIATPCLPASRDPVPCPAPRWSPWS